MPFFSKGRHLKTKETIYLIELSKGTFTLKHWHFGQFTINSERPPFSVSPVCKIFMAQHKDFDDNLAAKVYEGQHGLIPDSLHMNILRVLGKKNRHIIQTWGLFHSSVNNSFIIIQEWANRGSLNEYLKKNTCDEAQAGRWIQQIVKGLDYLGDVGITHRSLQPKHILLTEVFRESAGTEVRAKLSGFEMSFVYWDPAEDDIKKVPCLPLASRPTDKPSYQAPEVYGSSVEVFDPLVADVWSLGATIYYMFTKQYPYDYKSAGPTAVQQIQTNIANIPGLSEPGKRLLSEMLKPMAVERKHIDKLMSDPWIKSFK